MAISVTESQKQVTHFLRESPSFVAQQLNRRALLWDIAAKVTLAALFIITSAVVIMSVLGTAIFSNGFLALTVGLAIATPLLFHFERKFANRSLEMRYDARVEIGVSEHLRQVRTWKANDISSFFRKHQISDKTKEDMLPLIARFNFWEHTANIAMTEAGSYLDTALPGNKLVNQSKEVQHLAHQYGWKILVEAALPAKLQSALILRLLRNPYQEINLSQIGHYKSPTAEQQLNEIELDSQDRFFEFSSNRPPLTVQEIIDSSPDDLSKKL